MELKILMKIMRKNYGEGVYDSDKCIFMAPPENMVPKLMEHH